MVVKTRPRCTRCLSHGFFVYKNVNELDYTVEYDYECIDCGSINVIEWEDY